MTTKEFAGKLQACIKEYMTFDARDGANYNLELNDDDEALVLVGKDKTENFILHIIKINDKKNGKKNHKGNGTENRD